MKLEQLLVWGLLLMSMKSYAGERYYLSANYEKGFNSILYGADGSYSGNGY